MVQGCCTVIFTNFARFLKETKTTILKDAFYD